MKERHPVTEKLAFESHLAMASFWGKEALWAIRHAIKYPDPRTIEDLDMQHAVRCTRIAVWHALKAQGGRHGGV